MSFLRGGALLLLASCSAGEGAPAADLHTQVMERGSFAGVYEFGLEREAFRPCGGRRAWWVGGSPAGLRGELGQRSFVVVRGAVSPDGAYGHMGRYPRQIVITQVVSSSDAAEAGCPAAKPAG